MRVNIFCRVTRAQIWYYRKDIPTACMAMAINDRILSFPGAYTFGKYTNTEKQHIQCHVALQNAYLLELHPMKLKIIRFEAIF